MKGKPKDPAMKPSAVRRDNVQRDSGIAICTLPILFVPGLSLEKAPGYLTTLSYIIGASRGRPIMQ
ncbi:hypothetical protein [Niveispirillum fermenti]|uniref:hypothetical protein n=1 Tax=Niveispirillum fermenti TaxID=1233113 RepID=UPI003A8891B3